MLLGSLILITSIFSTNGAVIQIPGNVKSPVPRKFDQEETILQNSGRQLVFQNPEQVLFNNPEQQEVIFQPEQQGVAIFENSRQKLDQDQINDDYFTSDVSNAAGQETDFTISCIGSNRICTSKNDCVNGYIRLNKGTFVIPTHVQLGCAAALLCVEERFCTIDGTISPEPVTLSEKQLLRRVPMSSCRNPDNGIVGKCCRDPNYVDPWPASNLPANYSGGFDEQGFPTFLNIAKVRPNSAPVQTTKIPVTYRPLPPLEPKLQPENSNIFTETLIPPSTGKDVKSTFTRTQPKVTCGTRNKVVQQPGIEDSTTAFAEIPWQAMVLHTGEKKILCSGALVGTQDILTAANCVDSLSPKDVSIKLGEWKLGYELPHEEPLPFQIINVSSISTHPGYERGTGEHDLAMLHLESPPTFDLHINPLCLPKTKHFVQNNKPCISTGWGKSILQAHYAGVIMNVVNMKVLSTGRCKEQLLSTNFEAEAADGTICAAPVEEKNNVCETDVGGPLACQNEQGVYELVGIYSQDTGCLPTNQVAMFAPLDGVWLDETIQRSEESQLNIKYDYRKSSLITDNQYLPPV
ncbi:Serine proteinase stubble [Eufriesea mexicana]|nr:Serine proteinase stubble [Eufriesea mexicana]